VTAGRAHSIGTRIRYRRPLERHGLTAPRQGVVARAARACLLAMLGQEIPPHGLIAAALPEAAEYILVFCQEEQP
jgi:hypothetical protein